MKRALLITAAVAAAEALAVAMALVLMDRHLITAAGPEEDS